jgi:hypothetical protein
LGFISLRQSKEFWGFMTGRNVICAKCARIVARIVDEMYLISGNLRIYERTRFSCVCGKSHSFVPADVEKRGFDTETQNLLNRLGQHKKYQTQRLKGKK